MSESSTYMPSEGGDSAVLAWKDLYVTTKCRNKDEKVLLHRVSGVLAGGLTAVMGPSGSGKSTLLNALALRLGTRMKLSGQTALNGRPYNSAVLKQVAGYVMQDDLLNGQLTVEETLAYTAKLRCPPHFSNEQRQAKVEQAMADMGLLHVRNVLVGDPLNKGISGGERKRLCVAMELITDPALLFLDEPTSGLDSVTALGLITTLKQLTAGRPATTTNKHLPPPIDQAEKGLPLQTFDTSASPEPTQTPGAAAAAAAAAADGSPASSMRAGCTIVCTIHQPQSKIFHLFDQLLLLQAGCMVYQGPAAGALQHFAQMGFPCPAFTNPADHFMDLITVRQPLASIPTCPALGAPDMMPEPEQLRAYYKNVQVDMSAGADRPLLEVRQLVPWRRQYKVLLSRALKEQYRKTGVVLTQLAQAIVIAVLIGTVFLQIGTDQKSVVRRQPVLFFCVINQGIFAALVVINSFPSERLLVLRERAAGTYYASAYFMAKITAELASQLPIPLLFSCIVYWLVGLQPLFPKFAVFASFMVLCNMAATSLALMVSTWCRGVDLAITVLPMMLEVCRLFGGFFLSPANTPRYYEFLNALSYVKYTYIGISLNELSGLVLTGCSPDDTAPSGAKCVANGEQTIQQLGLNKYSMQACAGALLAYICVCRFMAYLGLRYVKW